MLLDNLLLERTGTTVDKILMGLMRLSGKSRRGVSLVDDPFSMILDATGVPSPKDYTNLDPTVEKELYKTLRAIAHDIGDGTLVRKKIPVYARALDSYAKHTRDAQTRYDLEGL